LTQAAAGAAPARGSAADFIRAHTVPGQAPLVPELTLRLASEITPIWHATEAWLHEVNIAPPFWAFAWPGGQAAARHILDHAALAAGKRVLDFACGGGIAGLAAARAGAAAVDANDIDPLALAACCLNAADNGLALTPLNGDIVGSACQWDLIVAGDVCYEAPMVRRILPWLRAMAAEAEVWVVDPGRAYLPDHGLERLAEYNVPTTLELEDQPQRRTVLYRLRP
jgi:predicted nicotinamide N-methyase